MRWLVVHPGPEFSVHDLYVGWVEALRELGQTVSVFGLNDRLTFYANALIETGTRDSDGNATIRKALTDDQAVGLAASGLLADCYRTWPDVILVISAFFIPPGLMDVMRSRRHKVVILHSESPYEDAKQLERAPHADINLINDPANLEAFRALGAAEYVPHAYRPAVHVPGPADPALASDFVFSGTGYESRIGFFEAMDLDGLEVALAGNWTQLAEGSPLDRYLVHDRQECLDNAQTAQLYRASRAGINIFRREADETDHARGIACGPREIEMAATQLFFLRDARPESDETFPMLPTFSGPGDASEKLRWWLSHDRQRQSAAVQARAAVRDRTFTANARRLLELLDRSPVKC